MRRITFAVFVTLCSIAVAAPAPQINTEPADPATTQPAARPTTRPVPAIERAIIISVDGLRPDMLLRANAPNMHHLYQSGSFSFWARTTAASVTLPSHTSMLTGAVPLHHGIEWNRDILLLAPAYPMVPTIFEVAHRAGYSTGMVVGKSKFAILAKPYTVDWAFIPDEATLPDSEIGEAAVKMIHKHRPQVLFVHLPSVDNTGHKLGWGTPEQIQAVEAADAALGKVLEALEAEKVIDSTFIVLTSDHGGAGRLHGPDDARSRHIPWIAVGPGIRKNLDLTTYPKLVIDTEDTFATVSWLLGIAIDPKNVDGKPITEIVQRSELLHSTN